MDTIKRARSARSYAIQQFFLNGGGEAHVIRVAHDGSAGGTAAAAAIAGLAPSISAEAESAASILDMMFSPAGDRRDATAGPAAAVLSIHCKFATI